MGELGGTSPRVLDELLSFACVGCGCTDEHACADGCSWVAPRICSSCVADVGAVLEAWVDRLAGAVDELVAHETGQPVDEISTWMRAQLHAVVEIARAAAIAGAQVPADAHRA